MIWCVSTYAHTHPHHRPAVISSLAIPPVYSVIEFPLWATFTRLYRYLSCCLHWCSLLLFLSNRSVALEHLPLSCRLVFPAFFSLSVDLYGELLRTRTLNQRCNVVYCIKWMGGISLPALQTLVPQRNPVWTITFTTASWNNDH